RLARLHRPNDGGDFHEVRSSTGDEVDQHRHRSGPQRVLQLDADAADLEDLVQRDGRRLALLYFAHKSAGTGDLALVLPPQVHVRKAFPAPAAQPAEVIKLQHL